MLCRYAGVEIKSNSYSHNDFSGSHISIHHRRWQADEKRLILADTKSDRLNHINECEIFDIWKSCSVVELRSNVFGSRRSDNGLWSPHQFQDIMNLIAWLSPQWQWPKYQKIAQSMSIEKSTQANTIKAEMFKPVSDICVAAFEMCLRDFLLCCEAKSYAGRE